MDAAYTSDYETFEKQHWWFRARRLILHDFLDRYGFPTAAAGDAVVFMDADLQDPPEVVPQMLTEYCRGYDVVYGRRVSRAGEGIRKRLPPWMFYRLMKLLVHKDLPHDVGDFRLVSRSALDALRRMRETHRFLRGMVAWVGFPQTIVEFHRAPRAMGVTKYPFSKLFRLAWTGAVSFSTLPLRLSLLMGLFVALLGAGVGAYALFAKLSGWYIIPGWTSLLVLLCLFGGSILVSNGLLGEYVGRIYEELKDRPLYIVSHTCNLRTEALPGSQPSSPAENRLRTANGQTESLDSKVA